MRAPPPEIRLKYGCADRVIMWLLKCTFQNVLTPLKEGSFKSCLGKSVVEGVLLRGMKRCTAGIRHARVPIRHEKKNPSLPTPDWKKNSPESSLFEFTHQTQKPSLWISVLSQGAGRGKGGRKKLQTIHKEDWNGKLWDLWQVADVTDKVQRVKQRLEKHWEWMVTLWNVTAQNGG